MVEFGHQYALSIFGALAFGDVDVDAHHPLRLSLPIIQNEAARLDPAQCAVGPNDAVLDVVFARSVAEGVLATLGNPIGIFWMRPGTPFAARRLYRALWQTVQRNIALRNMNYVGVQVIGITADQR